MNNDSEIQNLNSIVRWIEDDIIHIKWKEDVELEEKNVDDVSLAFQQLTNRQTVKVLSHFGNYVNITSNARRYAAEQSPKCIALAYVINSLAQRIVIRFYIGMRKRKNPTKVFNSFEEAKEWLIKMY